MSDYDPVKCLRKEVDRFKATNQFNPLLVTNFYLQAACVLTELETARAEVEHFKQQAGEQRRLKLDAQAGLHALEMRDQAWPLKDVVAKLCDAADILLHTMDYDAHGHELISAAWCRGRAWLDIHR